MEAPLRKAQTPFAALRGRVYRSLRASMVDGVTSSGMLGLVDTSLAPFGIAMRASAAQIASLTSLPNLVAALMQSQASWLSDWLGSRRKAVLSVIFVQIMALLLMAGLSLLPNTAPLTAGGPVQALIALAVFYITCSGLASPIWGSLMCEYLPLRKRSSYFGWRNRILGLVVIGAGLAAGWVLQGFGKSNLWGFTVLFLAAAVLRMVSWRSVAQMYEPARPWTFKERRRFMRFEGGAERNFFRFLLFGATMMAAVQLSGSLQSFYLLKDLQVSYFTYTLIVAASNATMFFMMGAWGRHADVSGNLKIIRLVSWLMPVAPALWLLSTNPVYLMVIQAFSGLAWAGYNLCITNYVYDAVPASERVRATSLYNMANSAAIFLGATLAGQLFEILPPLFGHRYLTLCALSAAARCLPILLFLPGVVEKRSVRQVHSMDLFLSIIGLKPLPGVPRETLRLILRNQE